MVYMNIILQARVVKNFAKSYNPIKYSLTSHPKWLQGIAMFALQVLCLISPRPVVSIPLPATIHIRTLDLCYPIRMQKKAGRDVSNLKPMFY